MADVENFKHALVALETDPSWNRNRTSWLKIKEFLDRLNERIANKSLETIVTSHRDLPQTLARIAELFTTKWWTETMIDDENSNRRSTTPTAMEILIVYLRAIRSFYQPQLEMSNLEKTSTSWAMGILHDLSDQVSSNCELDELLTVAMIGAGFATDDLAEDLARTKFAESFENARRASGGLFWTLPSHDLRRLLAWSCCLSKLETYQSQFRSLIDSIEPARCTLSKDCLAMLERLKRSIRYERE